MLAQRVHTPAELAAIFAQESDIRGMVASVAGRLQVKGIDCAEASQILASMPWFSSKNRYR